MILTCTFTVLATIFLSVRTQLGGFYPAQLSEEDINRLTNYSLEALHKVINSLYQYKVVRINDITSQLVSGTLYRLKLELGETTCLKGQDGSDCELRDPKKTIECEFSVYEIPWMNSTETEVVACN